MRVLLNFTSPSSQSLLFGGRGVWVMGGWGGGEWSGSEWEGQSQFSSHHLGRFLPFSSSSYSKDPRLLAKPHQELITNQLVKSPLDRQAFQWFISQGYTTRQRKTHTHAHTQCSVSMHQHSSSAPLRRCFLWVCSQTLRMCIYTHIHRRKYVNACTRCTHAHSPAASTLTIYE